MLMGNDRGKGLPLIDLEDVIGHPEAAVHVSKVPVCIISSVT